MTYKEQLKNKKWKVLRKRIIKRDKNKCTKCNSNENLQVHHTYYRHEHLAWEYKWECLITLCSTCHKKVHKENIIPVKPKTKGKRIKVSKKEKLLNKLSKSDRELSLRYEKFRH